MLRRMTIEVDEVVKVLQKHGTSWSVNDKLNALGTKEEVAAALWAARKAGHATLASANYTLTRYAGAPEAWSADDLCALIQELQKHFPDGAFQGGASDWVRHLPGSAGGLLKMLDEKKSDAAFGAAMRARWAALPRYWGTTVAYILVLHGQMPEEELPDDVLQAIAKSYLHRRDVYELPEVNQWLSVMTRARFEQRVLETALGADVPHPRWQKALVDVALGPDKFEIQLRTTAAELLPLVALEDVTKVLARLPEDTNATYAGEGLAAINILPSDDPLEALGDKVDLAWLERAIEATGGDSRRQPRNTLLMGYARRCVKEKVAMTPSVDAVLLTFLDMYPVGTSTNQESLIEALRLLPEARLEALILQCKQDQWGLVAHCPTQKIVDHAVASLATLLDAKQARYQPWGSQRYAPVKLASWKPSDGAEACWSWPFRAMTVAPALAQLEKAKVSAYCRSLLTVLLAVSGAIEALPALFDGLDSRDENQRAAALFGLSRLGADACLPELKARVGSRKKEQREGAALVLAALPSRADCYALAAAQAKVERVATIKAVLETVRPPKGEESSLVDQLIASDGQAWVSHPGDTKELVDAFRVAFATKREGGAAREKVVDARPAVLLGEVSILPVSEDLKARWGKCPFWFLHDAHGERSTLFDAVPESDASAAQTAPILEIVSQAADHFFASIETHIGTTDTLNTGLHADVDVATATKAFEADGFRVVQLKRWPPKPAVDPSSQEPLWPAWTALMEAHGTRADAQALTIDVVIQHSDVAWSMLDALGDRALLLADALAARLAADWPKNPKAKGAKAHIWSVSEVFAWLAGKPFVWAGPCWVAALGLSQKESVVAVKTLKAAGKDALPFLAQGLVHAQADVRRGALEVLDALRLPESLPALEAAAAAYPKEAAIRALIAALKSSELNLEALPLGAPGDALLDAALASLPCPPWIWSAPFETLPALHWSGGAEVSKAAAQWFIAAIGQESEKQREPKLALIRGRLTDASCAAVLSAIRTAAVAARGAFGAESNVRFQKEFAFATCFLGDDAALDETARNLENVVHIASGRHGRDALDALARRGTPAAVRALEWATRRSGSSTMKRRSGDALAEMASWRGLTTPELLDDALSDFGFDQKGELAFDFAGRPLTLKLGRDNALLLLDAEGRELKALPSARKGDDAEAVAAAKKVFSGLKKSLGMTHTSQRKRLEGYLAGQRTWFANTWRERFLGHALMRTYARSLLWEAINEQGASVAKFVVMESDLMNVTLDAVALDSSWRIRLLHPIGVPALEITQWSEVFADNQILPLFAQLSRPTFARAASDTALIDELPNVTCGPWMGAMSRCGYEQGPRGDGGNIYSTVRTVGRYVVSIEHDGYWPSDPNWAFALHRIVVTEAGKVIPWSALSEVFASELAYDLHRLTGALK